MKIIVITHYYPPEPGAPQARISEMAKVWKSKGHEVIIFTTFPNHPTGVIPDNYKRKFFFKDMVDGIKVYRHFVYATPNKGFFKKICSHLSFMFSVILFSLFREKKEDVLIVSSPTFFSVISAFIFSLIRRTPFIFEVRDLWPGIFVELNVLKNKILIEILELVELFLYRRAARVVTVTNGFKKNIVKRGIEQSKVMVITNGVDVNRFQKGEKDLTLLNQFGLSSDNFIVLYAGAHGISHALLSVLHSAESIRNDKIHFLFVGEGAEKEKLIKYKTTKDLSNVTFVSSIDKNLMPALYQSVDLCLVPLKNIEGFKHFIPSKMFEILACEKPIIASLFGEAANILKQSQAAFIIPPEDSACLSREILKVSSDLSQIQDMGRKGRDFVVKNFNREQLAIKYLEVMREVIKE